MSSAAVDSPFAQLFLWTLAGPCLERRASEGRISVALGPGKPLALLTYLALAPRRTASRAQLVGLLWSGTEPERARQTLRQTLSNLRGLLGDDAVASRGDAVTLVAAVEIDAREFLRAVREYRFADAVAAYARPFLDGFSVPGGEGFDEWALAERRRLQDAYVLAVEPLIRQHLDRGQANTAEPLARQLLDQDPLRQRSWRLLIEVLLSAGDEVGARLAADELERVLRDERCEPDVATRTMVRRAHRGVTGASKSKAPAGDAVGHEREFGVIVELWAGASSGTSRSAIVVGDTGAGKTRLLTSVARRLVAQGALSLSFGATPPRRSPFSLIASITERLAAAPGAKGIFPDAARTLVALAPSLAPTFATSRRVLPRGEAAVRLVSDALGELLCAVADEQPVALLIDDIDRADRGSRRVLVDVTARLEHERVLVIVSQRARDAVPIGGGRATMIELRPAGRRG